MPVHDHPRRWPLLPFGGPPPDVLSIEATVERPGAGGLHARWWISARAAALKLPKHGPGEWRDRLWEHTCFELFIAAGPGHSYLEYNLAPSGDWATFAFDGYRTGRRLLRDLRAPSVTCADLGAALEVTAHLSLPATAIESVTAGTKCAICAVLEDPAGTLSYWALAHPAARPDFHDPRGFLLVLSDTH